MTKRGNVSDFRSSKRKNKKRANYQNVQKGVVREPKYLERFFRNLLTDEKCVPEQLRVLLLVIEDEQYTLKQLMEKVGLKHRPTFLENYINPAMKDDFIRLLYPEKPNHPRQKYLLTVRGMAVYDELHG